MMKIFELSILIAALTNTAWLEWAILKHAGLLCALFFGGFFLLPWGTVAALAFLPRDSMR
ncbi:MAG: hypothetical protein FD174_3316 [Geobacteraceae bacterium]|nr:MAG: hypothetical protein FD174_3316 [Geobacteraceae bacterium]